MHIRTQPAAAPRPWSRRLLRQVAAATTVAALAIITGVVLLVARALQPATVVGGGAPAGGGLAASSPAQARDLIAAAPMASLDPAAATRPDPALTPARPIHLPAAVYGRGPAGVAVYGHTAEGALAQLAAIDVAVLDAMDVGYTGQVHQAWVLPGGPSVDGWDLAANVAAFLRGAHQASVKDAATTVAVVPAGGMVKGSDGPDWLVACVLLDVRATIQVDYRMGWGHCARMQWAGGRWQIGPGAAPAAAPSAWPGSKAAAAAGWLAWDSAEQQGVLR